MLQVNTEEICVLMSAGEWADSLTNISVGDLLNEASKAANSKHMNFPNQPSVSCLKQASFSCDSFDAAIAAHMSGHHLSSLSDKASQPSIWDAEETCDEFSFQMLSAQAQERLKPASSTCTDGDEQFSSKSSPGIQNFLKVCHVQLCYTRFEDKKIVVETLA